MKIGSKVCWLFFLTVSLMAILSPGPTLAQEEKTGLTLRLASGNYYNKVSAGEDKTLFLEIGNEGSKPITNIRLSSDKPEGWLAEFKPGSIASLGPDSFQTVDINLKPNKNATKGEYTITIIAEANETRKVMSIFVRVETTSSFWLWVGAGVATLVVAGFIIIFMRFGRQ